MRDCILRPVYPAKTQGKPLPEKKQKNKKTWILSHQKTDHNCASLQADPNLCCGCTYRKLQFLLFSVNHEANGDMEMSFSILYLKKKMAC